jgi:hypothetical protein
MLFEGSGNTSYRMTAEGTGFLALERLWGQGSGYSIDGVGVLDDEGGNDSYEAVTSLEYRDAVEVDDSCSDPDGNPCTSADATVSGLNCLEDYSICSVVTDVAVQGAATVPGKSVLLDRWGDDRYVADVRERFQAGLTDSMGAPTEPARMTVFGYLSPAASTQGARGVLVDRSGTDSYSTRIANSTDASATSAAAPGLPEVSAITGPRMFQSGQGASGALIDLAGNGDSFSASSENNARTTPDTGRALAVGYSWPLLQGDGSAGQFVALGTDPSISSSPPRPVCPYSPGVRGFGMWLDCGPAGAGPQYERVDEYPYVHEPSVGMVPNAVGTPTTIAFDRPSESGLAGDAITATVRLMDATGSPVVGAEVRFDLQSAVMAGVSECAQNCWSNAWEITAVTGPDGVATAAIPTSELEDGPYRVAFEGFTLQVYASFAGGPGLYPAYAALPVTIG